MISIRKILVIILLTLVITFILFPIAWMFVTSIKPSNEVFSKNPSWIPNNPSIEAYIWAVGAVGPAILNTIIVSAGSAVITIGLTIFAGYALARFNFKGKRAVLIGYISTLMFPKILIGIPVYVTFARLNLLDTHIGLILIYVATQIPVAVLLLRGFFENLPPVIEEAAMIDGCSRSGAFLRVLLPLSIPGLIAAGLFSFVSAWNDVLFALLLTVENTTISVEILRMVSTYAYLNWPGMMAIAIIGAIPPIVIFSILQKRLVSGLTSGALKGG
jgi:ABC-type glycerol-3-phosphate transport system permease component